MLEVVAAHREQANGHLGVRVPSLAGRCGPRTGQRSCTPSAVGATLEEERLLAAASDDARRASDADGKTVPAHVLGDGEDYELLFAVEGEVAVGGLPLNQVGYVTAPGLRLARTDGRIETLEPSGYVH